MQTVSCAGGMRRWSGTHWVLGNAPPSVLLCNVGTGMEAGYSTVILVLRGRWLEQSCLDVPEDLRSRSWCTRYHHVRDGCFRVLQLFRLQVQL